MGRQRHMRQKAGLGALAATGMAAAAESGALDVMKDPLENRLLNTEDARTFRNSFSASRHIDCSASAEEWRRRLAEDPSQLMNVPPEKQTKEMVLNAVSRNGTLILCAADHLLDEDAALAAVKSRPEAMKFLSVDLKTPAVCAAAVERDAAMLKYVPEHSMSQKMCADAVDVCPLMLKYVPDRFKTPGMCERAVGREPELLEVLSPKFRTPAVYFAAVKANPVIYDLLPKDMQTPELRRAAAGRIEKPEAFSSDAFYNSHPELWSPEVCIAAVRANPKIYRDIPESRRTPEVRRAGAESAKKMIEKMTLRQLKDSDVHMLLNFHPDLLTKEVCIAAVRRGSTLMGAPDAVLSDPEFRNAAIMAHPYNIKELKNASKQDWQRACRLNAGGGLLREVPKEMRSADFYADVVGESPSKIFDVPSSERTMDFYLKTGREMLQNLAGEVVDERKRQEQEQREAWKKEKEEERKAQEKEWEESREVETFMGSTI